MDTEILDLEVWVTPLTRYLFVEDSFVGSNYSGFVLGMVVEPDFEVRSSHGDGVKSGTLWALRKSQPLFDYLTNSGVITRTKEVAKPRFGETFWMNTNGIREWK